MTPPQSVYGFISALDCFLHIRTPKGDRQAFLSTAVHELAHYLQFIGTPVGCQIRIRQQWLSSDMSTYLHNQPQPIAIGTLGPALMAGTSPPGDGAAARLRRRLEECGVFAAPFVTREAGELFDACFPSPSASLDEAYGALRRTRPLEVDAAAGCFYSKQTGVRVPVAANCIMEYMARVVQLRHDGAFASPEALLEAVRNRGRAHYHLPLIFLIQEGVLDNLFAQPALYPMLMVLGQTSLLIDPLAVPREIAEKYNLDAGFRPQFLFLRALEDPNLFDSLVFLALVRAGKKPYRKFADFLLRCMRWPGVDELLACFARDMDDNIDLAGNRSRAANTLSNAGNAGIRLPKGFWKSLLKSGGLPAADRRTRQLAKFKELVFRLWDKDENLAQPERLLDEAPAPLMAEAAAGGLGVWAAAPGQTFWDPQFEFHATLQFELSQKLLFSTHLACYDDPMGETAMLACPHLEQCAAVADKAKIEFCRNGVWRDLVEGWLRFHELQLG